MYIFTDLLSFIGTFYIFTVEEVKMSCQEDRAVEILKSLLGLNLDAVSDKLGFNSDFKYNV